MGAYTPSPFPSSTLSMEKLRDWIYAELTKIAAALPGQLMYDAAEFGLPAGNGKDATPKLEQMLKAVPDGATIVFSKPGNIICQQEWVLTARQFITFVSPWSALGGSDDTRTTFRWARSTSGGRAFYLRSCHQVGFVNIAFIGEGEDVLWESDENGINGISGSKCFWKGCTLTATQRRDGHRLIHLSRTAQANQEWHRVEDSFLTGAAEVPYVGGRYDASNAGNLEAGSDIFTINGPLIGPGQPPTYFSPRFEGSDCYIATGSDGRTLFHTRIKKFVSPTSVRLADVAAINSPNCYFAVVNAKGYGISIGTSANSLKHRFRNNSMTLLLTAIEAAGGSFFASENVYFQNVRNLTVVGQMEPSCDMGATSENSLQHLFLHSDQPFELKGPARLALSTPMPARPYIAFGNGAMATKVSQILFGDRAPLPKGSTIYDPTRAYDWDNSVTGQPPLLQLLSETNKAWYKRSDLGLYLPFTGPAQIKRLLDNDFDGLVLDETITREGVRGR